MPRKKRNKVVTLNKDSEVVWQWRPRPAQLSLPQFGIGVTGDWSTDEYFVLSLGLRTSWLIVADTRSHSTLPGTYDCPARVPITDQQVYPRDKTAQDIVSTDGRSESAFPPLVCLILADVPECCAKWTTLKSTKTSLDAVAPGLNHEQLLCTGPRACQLPSLAPSNHSPPCTPILTRLRAESLFLTALSHGKSNR